MSLSKRLIPLIFASTVSVGYVFVVGADWGSAYRANRVISAVFTSLMLSAWAVAPYLMLLPIALRETRLKAVPVVAAIVVFAFGAFITFDQQHHMPGDEGLYLVVPAEQLALAGVILLGWLSIRAPFRRAAH